MLCLNAKINNNNNHKMLLICSIDALLGKKKKFCDVLIFIGILMNSEVNSHFYSLSKICLTLVSLSSPLFMFAFLREKSDGSMHADIDLLVICVETQNIIA